MDLFWKGKLDIDSINFNINEQFELGDEDRKGVEEHWAELQLKYPGMQEGELIWVDNIVLNNHSVTFEIRPIAYSYVRYLWANKSQYTSIMDGPKGVLTIRYFITNQTQDQFLLGRRNETSRVTKNQGKWSAIGGSVEYKLINNIEAALMEELEEELEEDNYEILSRRVSSVIKPNEMYINLIMDVTMELAEESIHGNKEFIGGKLYWKSTDFILNLKEEELFLSTQLLKSRLVQS